MSCCSDRSCVLKPSRSHDPEVASALHLALDRLDRAFDRPAAVLNDPLGCVHELPPAQREAGAHIAALLSYGAVAQIRRAIGSVFDACHGDVLWALSEPERFHRRLSGFHYRMTSADDVAALATGLGELMHRHGSLLAAFSEDDAGTGDIHEPLCRYVTQLRAGMTLWGPDVRGARYLTPDPATGSAVKRWCMMLRWLVRPDDGADLGLWAGVGAHRLVIPLDTHTSRLSWWLGLTERRTVDFRAAREVTARLAAIDRDDPLRFDMPLCHLGISKGCQHRLVESVCSACLLRGLCVFTRPASTPARLASKSDPAL